MIMHWRNAHKFDHILGCLHFPIICVLECIRIVIRHSHKMSTRTKHFDVLCCCFYIVYVCPPGILFSSIFYYQLVFVLFCSQFDTPTHMTWVFCLFIHRYLFVLLLIGICFYLLPYLYTIYLRCLVFYQFKMRLHTTEIHSNTKAEENTLSL